MFEKLIPIAAKYEDIEFRLSLPETAADPSVYTALIKEYHSLTPLVEAYRLYRGLEDARTEALELAELSDDPELRAMAEDEAEMLKVFCYELPLHLLHCQKYQVFSFLLYTISIITFIICKKK